VAALIRKSKLLVGCDTGWKHVAVALDVPTVSIFGPVPKIEWHPPGDQRHVAFGTYPDIHDERLQKDLECIKGISPDQVFQSVRKILSI
jgi:ADP-heptose:LPS heptosyltransferase